MELGLKGRLCEGDRFLFSSVVVDSSPREHRQALRQFPAWHCSQGYVIGGISEDQIWKYLAPLRPFSASSGMTFATVGALTLTLAQLLAQSLDQRGYF